MSPPYTSCACDLSSPLTIQPQLNEIRSASRASYKDSAFVGTSWKASLHKPELHDNHDMNQMLASCGS